MLSDVDPAIQKWAKYVLVFLICRVPRPFSWSSFLTLNPAIRRILKKYAEPDFIAKLGTPATMLSSLSNAITCAFLYRASVDNSRIAKDYMSIYLFSTYVERNSPSTEIYVSRFSKYRKLSHYNSPTLKKLYKNKELIIFPALFGQLLSNYLTPTRLGLNRKYQSQFIKSRILDPIWGNFSLGVRFHYVNWRGLLQKYLIHNAILAAFFLLTTFKTKFLDLYYKVKYGMSEQSVSHITKQYLLHAVHTANSWTNFMYSPNLISMLLISLSAPLMKPSKSKLSLKSYMKSIGFTAAFVTLMANSMDFIPDWGIKGEGENIRHLSKQSIDKVNDYIFQILILSKWRILKENHRLLRGINWPRIEAAVMSVGVYKLMSLNDCTSDDEVKSDPLVHAVGHIMK
ncbi:hypothetical protein JA9_001977 [Meyerozyma sp. JA9]|nr:hypothetical protein JA9_001977 [Meyerozyma sp. JA9]